MAKKDPKLTPFLSLFGVPKNVKNHFFLGFPPTFPNKHVFWKGTFETSVFFCFQKKSCLSKLTMRDLYNVRKSTLDDFCHVGNCQKTTFFHTFFSLFWPKCQILDEISLNACMLFESGQKNRVLAKNLFPPPGISSDFWPFFDIFDLCESTM